MHRWRIWFGEVLVEGTNVRRAVDKVAPTAADALVMSGVPDWAARRIECADAEALEILGLVHFPEVLMSAPAVCRICGQAVNEHPRPDLVSAVS